MPAATVTFDTTLHQTGNNTGIEVPPDLVEALGAGRRPSVHVDVNGYRYRTTVGVMGGRHLVSVSAAVRREAGIGPGDPLHVTLTVAEAPPEVVVPGDLAAALAEDPTAAAFFAALPNSLQRYHVDDVTGAKTPETRARRIAKAVAMFRDGRRR